MLSNFTSMAILIAVAAIAIAVTGRAIKKGKVGPQFGLSLKSANLSCREPTSKK